MRKEQKKKAFERKKQSGKDRGKNSRTRSGFRAELLPFLLLFSIQPLITFGAEVPVYLGNYPWFPDGEVQKDFFLYGKHMVFLILTAWILIILVDRAVIQRKKNLQWKRFLPLALYGILAVISAIGSVNHDLSLHGMWEQYEPIWVLLGYLIAVYGCSQVVESEEDVCWLLGALLAGAGVQALLGVMQLCGCDFWSTAFGRGILTRNLGEGAGENLAYTFAESGRNRVYLSLYNPNYAGVYLTMLIPIAAAALLKAEKTWQKAGAGILLAALAVCLVGSGSRTGMAVCAGLVFLILILRLKGKRRITAMFVCAVLIFAGAYGYDAVTDHSIQNGLAKSIHRTEAYRFQNIEAEGSRVHLQYKGKDYYCEIGMQGEQLVPVIRDEKGQMVNQEHLKKLQFSAFEENGIYFLSISEGQVPWYFAQKVPGGEFAYVTQYGKVDVIEKAPAVLSGYERALSGRGYIWGRTIPLLPSYLLKGSGPDTFILVFPQNDYVGRYHAGKRAFQEITGKAHSLYLQSAVQTGCLSLLCLLVFWGRYLTEAFSLYWRTKRCAEQAGKRAEKSGLWYAGAGISVSVCAYLLMGIMNDSNPATAPVFWGLLGVGIAANRIQEQA